MDRSTPTSSRGIRITVRRPDLAFLSSIPRLWLGGRVGATALFNVFTVAAPELEAFVIRDLKELLKRVKHPELLKELRAMMAQEAAHAALHARFNKVLEERGYPMEATRRLLSTAFKNLGATPLQVRAAAVIAAEHMLNELGSAFVEMPEIFADADPVASNLFRWHGYEEMEHKSIAFDVYTEIFGNGLGAYLCRIGALPLALLMLACCLVPPIHRFMQVDLEDPADVWAEWKKLGAWCFEDPGALRGFAARVHDVLCRDFHPWKVRDNPEDLEKFRHGIIKDTWAVSTPAEAAAVA
jgi:predicted metal-dependent hydrolase